MIDVFSEEMLASLSEAEKLRAAGEEDLSRRLSRMCAEEAAQHRGEDVLCLFYGDGVYGRIRNVADATACVFIAACAKQAYDVIAPKTPLSSGAGAWAKAGDSSNNAQMQKFFRWVSGGGRAVKADDHRYFRELMHAQLAAEDVYYKVSATASRYTLVEIVRRLVAGSLTLHSDGEIG